MIEKILFENLTKEYKLGYAFLSKSFLVTECNKFFTDFVFPIKLPVGKSIFDLVEETIGLEDDFTAVLQSSKKSINLDKINRENSEEDISFYNLKIIATGDSKNPLIFLVQDVTDNTDLYRINLQQRREILLLESILNTRNDFLTGSILGDSEPIAKVREMVKKISLIPTTTVLLQGESGTGKNLIARVIHYNNRTDKKQFVEINCAAIPENLLESELFGYEKGAFTNAISDKAGLLEEANGGTLFLDEISELPLKLQSKLLSFLETKRFRRLGSTAEKEVKVRFITATNKVLHELVKNGEFREDLFYRLNVVEIKLPSLKEMERDVLIIANHFLKVFNSEFKKSIKKFSKKAEEKILSHSWPGNVRELGNCIERSMIFCEGQILEEDDILFQEICLDENHVQMDIQSSGVSLEQVEKQLIQSALKIVNGNKSKAAQLLGVSRDTLRYRIEKHDLQYKKSD